jgi:hypothetical protein
MSNVEDAMAVLEGTEGIAGSASFRATDKVGTQLEGGT